MAKRKRKSRTSHLPAFDRWWCDPKRPDVLRLSPFEVCKLAFEAGRRSMPSNPKMRKALRGLLEMLEDWNAGFDGFYEVNEAEKVLGRASSKVH